MFESRWLWRGLLLWLFPLAAFAGPRQIMPLDMGLEELLDANVTTAARKEQRLKDVAAAIFVISREDIVRSGATSIPEALRMAPGIQVAQIARNRWAVSTRGFNGRFSNKLLVLMDGRSIYSPLFSGVTWEAEDTLLEDVERIEVIRGPGAAMWGANAVNGVINIITRHARDTQGNLLVASSGSKVRDALAFRHGGEGWGAHYRVWGKSQSQDHLVDTSSNPSTDASHDKRLGFRADWSLGAGGAFMVTGGTYTGVSGDPWNTPDITSLTGSTPTSIRQSTNGTHLLARRKYIHGDGSESSLQGVIDNYELNIGKALRQSRTTIDLDFQQRTRIGSKHDVVWGLGYRNSQDRINASGIISVSPMRDDFKLFGAFINDEFALIPDTLKVMAGIRVEHNSYTGVEPQPSIRMLWTPTPKHSVWVAASRASRTPSRAERDTSIDLLAVPGTPGYVVQYLATNNSSRRTSEIVDALEVGYRQKVRNSLSFDISAFHNWYDKLHSANMGAVDMSSLPDYVVQTIVPNNNLKARSQGVELAIDYRPASWWRLQTSYAYLRMNARSRTSDLTDILNAALIDGRAPKHQLSIRSSMTLTPNQRFDLWLRHVSALNYADQLATRVPAYTTLDLRYAWRPRKGLELSVTGQNLLHKRHTEFAPDLLPSATLQVERGVYFKITQQF